MTKSIHIMAESDSYIKASSLRVWPGACLVVPPGSFLGKLLSPSSYCWLQDRTTNRWVIGTRNSDFIFMWKTSRLRRWWTSVSKNHLPWIRIQAYLMLKHEGVIGCCKLLSAGTPFPCSCPCRSRHHAPIHLQQDKYYSLLCNFLISIWVEKCYTFKD